MQDPCKILKGVVVGVASFPEYALQLGYVMSVADRQTHYPR